MNEPCNLCALPIGKVFMLLAGSLGIVCADCATNKTKEVLELEAQMAD